MIADMLEQENSGKIDEQSLRYLQHLRDAGGSLRSYIDGMLIFYKSDELAGQEFKDINYKDLVNNIISMVGTDQHTIVTYAPQMDAIMHTNSAAMHQILLNLVSNSSKYGDKDPTTVHIEMKDLPDFYEVSVEDNGRGIAKSDINKVFQLFYTADEEDRHGNKGTGIGLATTKRLLKELDGTIDITSELGVGTKITIMLPKEVQRKAV